MKAQLDEYSQVLEAALAAVRRDVDARVESLGWDGEDGGPGTQGLRDRIEELVRQRWAVEGMVRRMGAGASKEGEGLG